MKFNKIVVVRKMSELEYYYNGNHKSNVLNLRDSWQSDSLEDIGAILEEAGKEYHIMTRRELSQEIVNETDLLISAGGDGTVIASAAYNEKTPQLNIRLDKGSRGALCNKDFRVALKDALEGKFDVEEWARQDVYLDGKFTGRALNEICVKEKGGLSKMAKYNLNGEYQENSGLVIVTGTGSGGWPKAFEKYSKDSKVFKYKVAFPAIGNEMGEANNFIIEYKNHEGMFELDTVAYDLPRDSVLEIKLSKNPLRVLG